MGELQAALMIIALFAIGFSLPSIHNIEGSLERIAKALERKDEP